MDVQKALQTLRQGMDHFVIGQDMMKEALVLALVGGEHIYVQGEPGCAKTMLAEVAAHTANLRFHFSQMHRDTRLSELVGNPVLRRTQLPDNGGEVISQGLKPGGLLDSEVTLLDDISRAPGEALNVLLRVLNERKYQNLKIPLMTAIATTNPTTDVYYNEPLDPANLDRFVFQVKTSGCLSEGDWERAREVMDRFEGDQPQVKLGEKIDPDALKSGQEKHLEVEIPRSVARAYQKILENLILRYGCNESNSMLSDRTMLVKTPRMIKAMAFIRGRMRAEVADLDVLKYILTFRVPEQVYEQLDEIIEEAAEQAKEEEEEEEALSDEEQNMPGEQGAEENTEVMEGGSEEEGEGDEDMVREIMDSLNSEDQKVDSQKTAQAASSPGQDQGSPQKSIAHPVENVEMLMEKIRGKLEHNPADMEVHPGGSPRSWRRMSTFDDFMDTDSGDTAIWLDSINPNLPRTYHRKKRHMGGQVVIVRDVSQSMEGRYARWTSSVVTKLVEVVRKKRMRIGYVEFNHISRKYHHDGRFFTRDYDKITDQAANVSCSGVTNYQYPLRDALLELKKGRGPNRHILFLTDGEPTQGDWLVREERKTAKQMGVFIHTLFIGTTECPEILDILSEETDGSKFHATPNDSGGLMIEERFDRVTEKVFSQSVANLPGRID